MSQSVWKLCASSLQDELPSQQFNTWIKPLQIDEAASPNELRLLAPNRFISNWVEEKFLVRIKELVGHFQENNNLAVVIAVGAKPVASFQSPASSVLPSINSHKDSTSQTNPNSAAVGLVEDNP
ncbi:MAG: chromosomal replication initiator protein DnaA, partial [Moraxellaceae bacterium]